MTTAPQYRMPAEWEQHAGTWLAWPHRESDWPGKLSIIPHVYCEIIRVLAQYEPVFLVVRDAAMQAEALALLGEAGADLNQVHSFIAPTNRSWLRDSGSIFVEDEHQAQVALDWRFNAWAKYDDWHDDDALPQRMAKWQNCPVVQPTWQGQRVVLEGGSIDVNGTGRMLTTEECLLSNVQERNPGLVRADYEAIFRQYLGITDTLWLNCGIAGDDTHGHVDDLARFVSPDTVALVVENNPTDVNYAPLQENRERLQAVRGLTVVELPMPKPVVYSGQRLPASYANFLIANGVVIVPTFNDPADRHVLGLLAELFPNRDVIGIHAVDLVWGLGTLHCMSQQQPMHYSC
jgi:agmatine deiminase